MQNVAALSFGSTMLTAAFLLSKNEVAALVSACGPKRKQTRTDERVVWLDWRRGSLLSQDRTLLCRLRDPRVSTDVAPLVVDAEALKTVAKNASAKDLIVIGRVAGDVVALGVIEAVDVEEHGDTITVKPGTGITFHDQPSDLVLDNEKLNAIVPTYDLENPGQREPYFIWDSRFTETLARVAKASGKGQALAMLPPLEDGAPFLVVVEAGRTVDAANVWEVVAMPLAPSSAV